MLTCDLGQSSSQTTTITIDVLPNDTLLDIFDFHRIHECETNHLGWEWYRLVHVCRLWRQIIVASPLRLRLHLRCTNNTPVRQHLDVWPPLPLIIDYDLVTSQVPNPEDNLLAALEHPDRVVVFDLCFMDSHLEKLATVLQKPFPVLTSLRLALEYGERLLPAGFLDGSMPSLQYLHLLSLPFPELPKLLLSTRSLVTLDLHEIPPSGYISPQAMATCLSTLTGLTYLSITFQEDVFVLPDQIDPASVTPIALPSLISIYFKGICEYTEPLFAQIDCPRLQRIDMSFYDSSFGFQVTELSNFVNRSEDPGLPPVCRTNVHIGPFDIALHIFSSVHDNLMITLRLSGEEWDILDLVHVFSKFSHTLSNTRELFLGFSGNKHPEIAHSEWVQLLRPFTTMQALTIFGDLVAHVALFLEDVDAEMASNLVPALEFLCIEDLPESLSVAKFCAFRQLSGRPVTFTRSMCELDEILPWNAIE